MYGRSRSIPMAYPWFGPGAKHRKAIRSFLSHSSERIWGHPSQVLVKSALLGFTVLLSAGGIARSPRFKIIPHDCILLPVVGKKWARFTFRNPARRILALATLRISFRGAGSTLFFISSVPFSGCYGQHIWPFSFRRPLLICLENAFSPLILGVHPMVRHICRYLAM